MKTHEKYGKPPCIFKAGITEEKFWELARHLESRGDWSQMVYIYFDTSADREQAELYHHDLRLRVRVKGDRKSLELKDYRDDRHWDIGQLISEEQFRCILHGELPDGEISRILSVLELKGHLHCINLANTNRQKTRISDGILVLDTTDWPGKTCYEVEYRSGQKAIPAEVRDIRQRFCCTPRRYDKMETLWGSVTKA